MYWAILKKAGFQADEERLKELGLAGGGKYSPNNFNPHFNRRVLEIVYGEEEFSPPRNLIELQLHLERIAEFNRNSNLESSSGEPLFEADDKALLNFLNPSSGGGPRVLRP